MFVSVPDKMTQKNATKTNQNSTHTWRQALERERTSEAHLHLKVSSQFDRRFFYFVTFCLDVCFLDFLYFFSSSFNVMEFVQWCDLLN